MPDLPALVGYNDPELRHMAIMADAFLGIESARAYGLVEGGPTVNVMRAEDIIAAAQERGLEWTDDERTSMALALIQQWNESGGVIS